MSEFDIKETRIKRLCCATCSRIIGQHSEADLTRCIENLGNKRCMECDVLLSPVWNDLPSGNLQGVLNLSAHSGYGEFIDNLSVVRIQLCETCATKLCEHFPKIKEALKNSW